MTLRPVTITNADFAPQRRELGLYAGRKSATLKIGLPPAQTRALGWTHKDSVIVGVWERVDGTRVLVLERDREGGEP